MNKIIQLKIFLEQTEPLIWRRVLIHKNTNFLELHHIIQIAMGWQNYHMFEFEIFNYAIGIPHPDFENDRKVVDARDVTLSSLISDSEEFQYEYDFGDSWKHKKLFKIHLIKK